eukprot:1023599-Pyramimonas_sp.AAC.1
MTTEAIAGRRKRLLVGGAKLSATLQHCEPEWQQRRQRWRKYGLGPLLTALVTSWRALGASRAEVSSSDVVWCRV